MQRCVSIFILALSVFALPVWAVASAGTALCDTSFLNLSICPGQSVFIAGNTYDAQNNSGTSILTEASWDGTDSVVVVNLTLMAPVLNHITSTFCSNQALIVNGHVYDADSPNGVELLPGAANSGCDSMIVVDLIFLSASNHHLVQTICNGDTVWVNNQAYDEHYYLGMETIVTGAANGCDSVILVDLTILTTPSDTLRQILCPNETLKINGIDYNIDHPFGSELLPNAASNGCDSIIYVELTFSSPPAISDFLGPDQSVNVNDSTCISIPSDLNIVSVAWFPASNCTATNCSSICFSALEHQVFSATIIDQNNCAFADTVLIKVSKDRPIYFPNAFSPTATAPNNQFFLFPGTSVTNINWMQIYDRWGSLIYETRDFSPAESSRAWDGNVRGRPGEPGVYAFAFEVLYPDGLLEVRTGSVTLIR